MPHRIRAFLLRLLGAPAPTRRCGVRAEFLLQPRHPHPDDAHVCAEPANHTEYGQSHICPHCGMRWGWR